MSREDVLSTTERTQRLCEAMSRYHLSIDDVARITCTSVGCVKNWRSGGQRPVPEPMLRLVELSGQDRQRERRALALKEREGAKALMGAQQP